MFSCKVSKYQHPIFTMFFFFLWVNDWFYMIGVFILSFSSNKLGQTPSLRSVGKKSGIIYELLSREMAPFVTIRR